MLASCMSAHVAAHQCLLKALTSCLPAFSAGIGNTQIWGTQPDSIDEAEDRDRWMACLQRLDIKQPPGGMVTTEEGAIDTASKLGYPVRHLCLLPCPDTDGCWQFYWIHSNLACSAWLLRKSLQQVQCQLRCTI